MLTTATEGEGENVDYAVKTRDCYFRERSLIGLWMIHHNVINPTTLFMVFRVTYLFGVAQCYNFLPIM